MDPRTFRDIIGHFATGVTVITTSIDGREHGMTANAVSSVSLDPMLLLVCVGREAECHRQLSVSERFGVNILLEGQEDISNHFARSGGSEGDESPFPFRTGSSGVPLLPDCLAVFECSKHAVLDGGDHDIFVGRVDHGEILHPGQTPLVFFAGAYQKLERHSSSSH